MRIMLTGCAGFIGVRVTALLLDGRHEVIGIDSLVDSPDIQLREWRLNTLSLRLGFSFHSLDISDADQLMLLVDGGHQLEQVSEVMNLGALAGVRGSVENPRRYYEVNVLGTLNLLEVCRELGVGRFVQPSTSSVYGEGIEGPVNEDSDSSRPLSPYAASKKGAEALLHSYHHLYGMNVAVLRYFTVYGPAGRTDMSIFRFIRNIVEGEPITVFGDGTQRRDFTYVDDIARGTVAALGVPGYETINLGYGSPVALNDVIRLIEKELGRPAMIEHQDRHPADPMMTWADISRARSLLGWTPTVDIEEGIRRTVEWYLANRDWARALT